MTGFRLAHLFFLGRAIARGPKALAGYAIRRTVRRRVWHLTKPLR